MTEKNPIDKWKDGIDKADQKWDAWDCEIQKAVKAYNDHLSGTPGYVPLDWQMIKAMLWVESGPHQKDWKFKPMQIGKFGDPGMEAFFSGKEGGDLIIPPSWKELLTPETVSDRPENNIRAGIGYLLMRMAEYEYRSVLDSDTKVYEVVVKPGDSFEKIANRQGSTPEVMKRLNPEIEPLRLKVGQVVKYQKASLQRVITGWRRIYEKEVAARYNGGGDPAYSNKLSYAFSAIRQRRTSVCAN